MASTQLLWIGELSPDYTSPVDIFTNFTIDGATDQAEFIFSIPEAATITHLGFRYAVRTGTPVQHKISLQSVTGAGIPDGTILGGGAPASGLFTPPANVTWNATWQWVALDNSYVTTRGQLLAIVIAPVGTPDVSNSSAFSIVMSNSAKGFPYAISNDAGTRTRQSHTPLYGLKSSTTSYGFPLQTFQSTQYSSDSNPDEYAQKFNLHLGFGSTYQVAGVRVRMRPAAAGKTLVVNLYDGTTVLQSITFDSDHVRAITNNQQLVFYFDETTLATLNFGQDYRIGFQAQEVSSGWAVDSAVLSAAGDLTALSGGGMFSALSTRSDAGAWSDETTKRSFLQLILADWTEPAGDSVVAISNVMMFGGPGVVAY
jgi:hypothetical protein